MNFLHSFIIDRDIQSHSVLGCMMSTSDTIRLHNPQNRCHENREKREKEKGSRLPFFLLLNFFISLHEYPAGSKTEVVLLVVLTIKSEIFTAKNRVS